MAELEKLFQEWLQWEAEVARIEDHSYDSNTELDVFADGRENMRKHDILQAKTRTFLDNNLIGHYFLTDLNGSSTDRTDLRLKHRVTHRIRALETIRASLQYAKQPEGGFAWTADTALQELDRLISTSRRLESMPRKSADQVKWCAQTLAFLEEVFGRDSRYYKTLSLFKWGASSFVLDGSEPGYETSVDAVIEGKHQAAFVQQHNQAQGLLDAAREEIQRKGIKAVYKGKDTGPEASNIMKVVNLAENGLRKIIRDPPDGERLVQDAFESLLVGAQIPYSREKDRIEYSSKTYVPDFTMARLDLAIDLKLCNREGREKAIIAEINDDICAYQTKYGNLMFIVYDCGFIRDVDRFASSLEGEYVVVCVVKH